MGKNVVGQKWYVYASRGAGDSSHGGSGDSPLESQMGINILAIQAREVLQF